MGTPPGRRCGRDGTASEPDVPGVTSNEHPRTEAVQVKRMLAAAVTTFLLTGCSSPTSESANACSVDPAKRSAEVVTQPEVAEVSESASNVGLHVTSTLEERVRLAVRSAAGWHWTLKSLALPRNVHINPFTSTPTDCLWAKRQ